MVKKILIGLAGLIVALLLIAFILPGKIEVSKSITINAPAENIFGEINNLENNANWSYWNNLYKDDMTITYGDIREGVGAFSSWDGEESGKGSMTITESVPNKSLKLELNFMEEGTAESWYTLKPDGEGTTLTTGFIADMGMNPIGRYFGTLLIKPEMEKAFDYNLTKLKEMAEAKPVFTVSLTEVETPPVNYIGISSTMRMDDMDGMSAQMRKSYGELAGVLQKANVMTSPPFCLYPRWDDENKEIEMVCALTVPANANLPAKYKVMQTTGGKAVKAIHLGDYHKLDETHNQIAKYIEYKKLEINGAPWEVYVTDPETEPDATKWITEVYYPVKK